MWTEAACSALRSGKVLELTYDGFSRRLEVHAVGYSELGLAITRAWQVQSDGSRARGTGWKLVRLDEAISAAVIDEPSRAPRRGYKRGDAAMDRIIWEL